MKKTFYHFKELFKGNTKLYEFLEFLTANYIIENKPITETPVKDGYDVCFLAFNSEALQEIFNKCSYEQLQELGKQSPDAVMSNIPISAYYNCFR